MGFAKKWCGFFTTVTAAIGTGTYYLSKTAGNKFSESFSDSIGPFLKPIYTVPGRDFNVTLNDAAKMPVHFPDLEYSINDVLGFDVAKHFGTVSNLLSDFFSNSTIGSGAYFLLVVLAGGTAMLYCHQKVKEMKELSEKITAYRASTP